MMGVEVPTRPERERVGFAYALSRVSPANTSSSSLNISSAADSLPGSRTIFHRGSSGRTSATIFSASISCGGDVPSSFRRGIGSVWNRVSTFAVAASSWTALRVVVDRAPYTYLEGADPVDHLGLSSLPSRQMARPTGRPPESMMRRGCGLPPSSSSGHRLTTSAFSALAKTTATAARLTGDDSASSSLTGGIRRPLLSSRLEAVKFDKSTERWVTDDPDEEAGSSYGPIGSLYRAGPRPFLSRIFDADTYDQAVLKYMASEGCDRKEAQGNMDAFLDNPQDWGYQKIQEKEAGAFKKDYANANMDPKSVILSTVWAAGVVYFFGDLALKLTRGEIMADSFHRTMELLGVEYSACGGHEESVVLCFLRIPSSVRHMKPEWDNPPNVPGTMKERERKVLLLRPPEHWRMHELQPTSSLVRSSGLGLGQGMATTISDLPLQAAGPLDNACCFRPCAGEQQGALVERPPSFLLSHGLSEPRTRTTDHGLTAVVAW
ncbi:hypothetical protein THAOC_12225 [Thalassiosira oceanica]|uniref:Uncharacterized protein n=1 Tax=Thalassiosira oceanica TaxID=159749 RepID=K0SN74_THAOC|nr:hypothetical protein THAOC_12225 [Thalassiosira oceanica]|eukprot:EJK66815.1 hypothetical protein THAOC_12225 [Thalassiosira oceanica]